MTPSSPGDPYPPPKIQWLKDGRRGAKLSGNVIDSLDNLRRKRLESCHSNYINTAIILKPCVKLTDLSSKLTICEFLSVQHAVSL